MDTDVSEVDPVWERRGTNWDMCLSGDGDCRGRDSLSCVHKLGHLKRADYYCKF